MMLRVCYMVIFMEKSPVDSTKYRYEIKYIISRKEYIQLLKNLSAEGFYYNHESNIVNNLYFDDYKLQYMFDNLMGVANRKKYRFRWYGESNKISKGNYETKIKEGNINYKKILRIKNVNYDIWNIAVFKNQLSSHLPPDQSRHLEVLHPTLINRYYREYYISKRNIRLTVDKDIQYCNPSFVQYGYINERNIVVEIKYSNASNLSPKMFDGLDLKLAKNSKYVNGILAFRNVPH
jgi:hypothetical protein